MNLLGEVIFDLSRITSAETTLAFVGYVIVFIALITLYFVFQYVPIVLNMITKKKLKKQGMTEVVISDLRFLVK